MYSLDTKYTEVHPVWFTVFSLWFKCTHLKLTTTKYILSGSLYFHYEIKYSHLKLTTTKYILSGSPYFHYEMKCTHLKLSTTKYFLSGLPYFYSYFHLCSEICWKQSWYLNVCGGWFFLYYYSSIPLWTKQRELRNPSDFITSQLL